MKRWAIGSIAFLAALLIGFVVVDLWNQPGPKLGEPDINGIPAIVVTDQTSEEPKAPASDFIAEFHKISIDELFPIDNWNEKLIDEPTSGFLPEDIVTKPGERWLAAEQKKDGTIVLISSKMQLTKDKNDGQTVSVKFGKVANPIFAVKDLKNVKAGTIKTTYFKRVKYDPEGEEVRPKMTFGFRQQFELNNKKYYLRVAKGTDDQGMRMGFLVLGDGTSEQVIDYSPYWDEIELHLGILVWAGDMDDDGKLDLYLDRTYTEEKSGTGLFLSSHAEKGKLVKVSALFAHAGC